MIVNGQGLRGWTLSLTVPDSRICVAATVPSGCRSTVAGYAFQGSAEGGKLRKKIAGALVIAASFLLLAPSWAVTAARAGDAQLIPAEIDKSAGPVTLKYPKDAQARGEEGNIDLFLLISSGGHPTGRYKIAKSTGYDDLDNAALESALNWRYVPARTKDGDAHSSWMRVHIEFKLPKVPGGGKPDGQSS